MVGPFPAPVHGFSVANAAVREAFEGSGHTVRSFNTASTKDGKIHRLVHLLRCHLRFLVAAATYRRHACMYLAVSGGSGQYSDLLFAAGARLFGLNIVFHHHSFSYLSRFLRSMSCLAKVGGGRALHVTLCKDMRRLLCGRYSAVRRTMILSNAALLSVPRDDMIDSDRSDERRLQTLGYFGNITFEKGIDRFLALITTLRASGVPIQGQVAGPIIDPACRKIVDAAVADHAVTYHGPLYGEEKAGFFDRIDLLVFPSRYPNEAEPFVVLEAMSAGVPVIATARGCTPALVDNGAGVLLDDEGRDLSPAVRQISRWVAGTDPFPAVCRAARDRAAMLRESGIKARSELISKIFGG